MWLSNAGRMLRAPGQLKNGLFRGAAVQNPAKCAIGYHPFLSSTLSPPAMAYDVGAPPPVAPSSAAASSAAAAAAAATASSSTI